MVYYKIRFEEDNSWFDEVGADYISLYSEALEQLGILRKNSEHVDFKIVRVTEEYLNV